MRKVLMITDTFPYPGEGKRPYRLTARASVSLEYGWETVIVCPQEQGQNLEGTPGESRIKVYQVPTPFPAKRLAIFGAGTKLTQDAKKAKQRSRIPRSVAEGLLTLIHFVFFPDTRFLWIIPLYKKAREILGKEDIDAICTMCYPFSLHVVGLLLKRKLNLPWMVEFRDPWVRNPYRFNGEANILHKIAEKKVIERADKVVFHNGIQIEDDYFCKTYPHVGRQKFEKLPYMGFDPDEFTDITPHKFEQFTISHAGNFYWKGHDPRNFLLGLHMLMKELGLSARHIRANFMGNWGNEYDILVKQLGLADTVHCCGWVPRERCLEILKGSNLLLYINSCFPGDELSVSTKTWDYVGAQRPILVLAKPKWKSVQLVQNERLGIAAEMDDPSEIKEALKKAYNSYKNNEPLFSPSEEFLHSLDHKIGIRRFCCLLDDITEEISKG